MNNTYPMDRFYGCTYVRPDERIYAVTTHCYCCGTYFTLRDDQEEGGMYECPDCEAETERQAIAYAPAND